MKPCSESCGCTVFHQDTLNKVEKHLFSDQTFDDLTILFKLLNDKTRIKILESIKDEYLCVCDLSYLTNVSKSAISHQMKLLKKHHIVEHKKEGKMVYYHLKDQNIASLIHYGYLHTKGNELK